MRLDSNMSGLASSVIKSDKLTTPGERLRYLGWLFGELPIDTGRLYADLTGVHNKLTAGKVEAGSWDFDIQRKVRSLYEGYFNNPAEALRFAGWVLQLTPELPPAETSKLQESLRTAFLNLQQKAAA